MRILDVTSCCALVQSLLFGCALADTAPRGVHGNDNHGTALFSALSYLVISNMKVLKRKQVESEGVAKRHIRFWDG